jgi:hypothetical protein
MNPFYHGIGRVTLRSLPTNSTLPKPSPQVHLASPSRFDTSACEIARPVSVANEATFHAHFLGRLLQFQARLTLSNMPCFFSDWLVPFSPVAQTEFIADMMFQVPSH